METGGLRTSVLSQKQPALNPPVYFAQLTVLKLQEASVPLAPLRLSRFTSWPPTVSLALTVSNHIFLFPTLSSFLPPLLLVHILFDLHVFSFSAN